MASFVCHHNNNNNKGNSYANYGMAASCITFNLFLIAFVFAHLRRRRRRSFCMNGWPQMDEHNDATLNCLWQEY